MKQILASWLHHKVIYEWFFVSSAFLKIYNEHDA